MTGFVNAYRERDKTTLLADLKLRLEPSSWECLRIECERTGGAWSGKNFLAWLRAYVDFASHHSLGPGSGKMPLEVGELLWSPHKSRLITSPKQMLASAMLARASVNACQTCRLALRLAYTEFAICMYGCTFASGERRDLGAGDVSLFEIDRSGIVVLQLRHESDPYYPSQVHTMPATSKAYALIPPEWSLLRRIDEFKLNYLVDDTEGYGMRPSPLCVSDTDCGRHHSRTALSRAQSESP